MINKITVCSYYNESSLHKINRPNAKEINKLKNIIFLTI